MTTSELVLPPGFRFHPTDEELVNHYLCRKCASLPIAVPIIKEIDLYKFDPWQLPEMAVPGEKEWYFFTPRDRKYPNGSRPNRAAGTGYWKATGADKPIGRPKTLGIKKALVFYAGKARKGAKTNWIMHEYRLANVDRSAGKKNNSRLDEWVLCRIYNKKGSIEKHNTTDYNKKITKFPEIEDQKPNIIMMSAEHEQPWTLQMTNNNFNNNNNDQWYHSEMSDSMPRLNTDSSGSEHVTSPEVTGESSKEVESEPKWRELESAFDNQSRDYMDIIFPNEGFGVDQLDPFSLSQEDLFMYLQ